MSRIPPPGYCPTTVTAENNQEETNMEPKEQLYEGKTKKVFPTNTPGTCRLWDFQTHKKLDKWDVGGASGSVRCPEARL